MSNLNSLNNSNSMSNTSYSSKFNILGKNKGLWVILLISFVIVAIIFGILIIIITIQSKQEVNLNDKIEEVLLSHIHDCKNNPLTITSKKIPTSTLGNEYCLTFWVFMNNIQKDFVTDAFNSGQLDIITKGKLEDGEINTKEEQPLKIYLDPGSTTLKVDMKVSSGSKIEYGHLGCYKYDNSASFPSPSLSNNLLVSETQNVGNLDYTQCQKYNKNNNKKYFGMMNPKDDKNSDCFELTESDIIKIKSMVPEEDGKCRKMSEGADLSIYRETLGSDDYMFVSNINENKESIFKHITQFPMERWNCITLNVHNNICDIFFDGKLYHTNVFNGRPELNNDPIVIGNNGGFDGYVSNVTWSNKTLHPQDIYDKYAKGPRLRVTANERIKYIFTPGAREAVDIADEKEVLEKRGRV